MRHKTGWKEEIMPTTMKLRNHRHGHYEESFSD